MAGSIHPWQSPVYHSVCAYVGAVSELPLMCIFLDCGRKLKFTHGTCKLHIKVSIWNQNQNLLAMSFLQ